MVMGRKGLLQRRKMVDPPCEKNRWVSGVGRSTGRHGRDPQCRDLRGAGDNGPGQADG